MLSGAVNAEVRRRGAASPDESIPWLETSGRNRYIAKNTNVYVGVFDAAYLVVFASANEAALSRILPSAGDKTARLHSAAQPAVAV
jgi:hypothetical protein